MTTYSTSPTSSSRNIGVIGDSEQAIFGFCGAKREDFIDFQLPGIKRYTIADNRRSTNNIIAVLNNARTDGIQQKGLRNTEGSRVALLVGDISKAYEHVRKTQPVMLARDNQGADLLRTRDFTKQANKSPWSQLEAIDLDRYLFVKAVIEAYTLLSSGYPGSAVRKFLDEFRGRGRHSDVLTNAPYITDTTRRALALTLLCCMQENYPSLRNKPFQQTYNALSEDVAKLLPGTRLKRITTGSISAFAQAFTLQQLLDTSVMIDDTRDAKTIHKAKGAEFDTVLLYLPKEDDLDKILNPKAASQQSASQSEEQRILYVGISRARDNLCISVPTLSPARMKTIDQRKLPIEVIDL
ncbi:MAG: hypothetical protein NTU41_05170 [Chloroflexi bacterium]|nr:hypothetical protein [Chloroflexota bacterium]